MGWQGGSRSDGGDEHRTETPAGDGLWGDGIPQRTPHHGQQPHGGLCHPRHQCQQVG